MYYLFWLSYNYIVNNQKNAPGLICFVYLVYMFRITLMIAID